MTKLHHGPQTLSGGSENAAPHSGLATTLSYTTTTPSLRRTISTKVYRSNDIALKNQPLQDIAAEGSAPPKWTVFGMGGQKSYQNRSLATTGGGNSDGAGDFNDY
jgi:hypothetical protein